VFRVRETRVSDFIIRSRRRSTTVGRMNEDGCKEMLAELNASFFPSGYYLLAW
jgi:hypothetical protein